MKKSRSTGPDLLPALVLLLLGVLWQVIVTVRDVPVYLLPSPIEIGKAFVKEFPLLMQHAGVTVLETVVGLGLSLVLGVGIAIAMALSGLLRRILYPIFVISQTIPLIVLAPLLMVWFGFGLVPKLIVVTLVCFFPIAVGFAEGLVSSDPALDELLTVMGASRWKVFRLARVPQGLPGLFAGLKIAATYAVMGAVLSEWVGAKSGLGIYMTRTMSSFKTAALFADILLVVALSLLLFKFVEIVEKRVLKHRITREAQ